MKPAFILLLSFFVIFGCKKELSKVSAKQEKYYYLSGIIDNKNGEILLLHLYRNNKLIQTDSTIIANNQFYFKGYLDFPHKASLQVKGHTSNFPFILANDSAFVNINNKTIRKSTLSHSPINAELAHIRKHSSEIYRKIDYLFPQLQKARIENDVLALNNIHQQINLIIKENQEYLYSYIKKNPENYLSGLLLNDLWNSKEKDSIYLQKLAKQLPQKTQKILDFAIH